MLKKCGSETKIDMTLPLNEKQTLIFIDWLARVKSLKGSTINSYLAGLRQLHIATGLPAPELRSDLVKLVLKGISNANGIESRKKNWSSRLPLTVNSMLLFKKLINNSEFSYHDKALLWAVSTVAFAGAFRIHEILDKTESTFDPDFTLLTKDISLSLDAGQEVLHVKPKCKTAAATIVDLYQNDGRLCPIKAFKNWMCLKFRDPVLP